MPKINLVMERAQREHHKILGGCLGEQALVVG
jgi:anthranilate/para-aminobenzoate synthase component II